MVNIFAIWDPIGFNPFSFNLRAISTFCKCIFLEMFSVIFRYQLLKNESNLDMVFEILFAMIRVKTLFLLFVNAKKGRPSFMKHVLILVKLSHPY